MRGPREPEGLRRRAGPCSDGGIAAAQEDTAFYEITPQFSGIEAGAVWEVFRIGMEHLLRWERVAVVTDIEWIRHTVNVFRFLLPGKIRVFAGNEAEAAHQWIVT